MRPIAQHHYSVESQARFRTIPVNEFIDGVTITSLGVQAGEAILDYGFGVLEVLAGAGQILWWYVFFVSTVSTS
jgi:hypothetical protein